jgi:hypothetical protein
MGPKTRLDDAMVKKKDRESSLGLPARRLVTILTELSQLRSNVRLQKTA